MLIRNLDLQRGVSEKEIFKQALRRWTNKLYGSRNALWVTGLIIDSVHVLTAKSTHFIAELLFFSWFNFSISYFYSLLVHVDYVNYHVVIFMAHLHLNELSLICDMWLNKITYLLTYLHG